MKTMGIMKKSVIENNSEKISVIAFSATSKVYEDVQLQGYNPDFHRVNSLNQDEYEKVLEDCQAEVIVLVDVDRFPLGALSGLLSRYYQEAKKEDICYFSTTGKLRWWENFSSRHLGSVRAEISGSPVLIGQKKHFRKAYAAGDLNENLLVAAGYSLQKKYMKFRALKAYGTMPEATPRHVRGLALKYTFQIPCRYLLSGAFFRNLLEVKGKVQRDMVFRMLVILFAVFSFLYMPFISKDYGISGDEIMEHNHSQLVLNYFENGDKAATYQPKTTTHFYGISLQIICGAIARYCHVDDVYAMRHVVCALTGALGVLFAGLLGLRWGGGLCGLLSILLMFFTPRYFGHSMNNLKDIPFAVGYLISIYYTIRLFDTYPYFKLRNVLGLILGFTLALSTRSGGLVLFPMTLMYAGLFYILYYGVREFYKFGKYAKNIGDILSILFIACVISYFLSILLWPFALEKPFSNMFVSLKQFTHFSIGLRTIFEGKQMMSNMLPWNYAPEYFMIAVPVVTLAGFWGYMAYCFFRKKEFSLISYFLLFSAIFPVFWVIYKNSNLYGGIRHLLFVMPVMVVIAGRFWTLLIRRSGKWSGIALAIIFMAGLSLPVSHMIRNHPNDYIYFNELIGGVKGAYGDYEIDYYYNALKESVDWLKEHEDYKNRKIKIITNHAGILEHYFRKDTNVTIAYTRYYEKYSKDWDYAVFSNVYINTFQLKHGLFPPPGTVYTSEVDRKPASVVIKRGNKEELQGFQLGNEGKLKEGLEVFQEVIKKQPHNEEIWARMSKYCYQLNRPVEAEKFAQQALKLHPELNEPLYILAVSSMQQKKYNEALQAAQKMLDQNIASIDAYYLKALVFKKMGRYKEAIQQLNLGLSYRPKNDRALVLAADILKINRNYEQAVKIYSQALEIRNTVQTAVALADCYVRMGDYEKAEHLLTSAQKAQGNYFPLYIARLRMSIRQNDLQGAATLLQQLGNTNDADLYILQGAYQKAVGKKQEALACVEEALKLEPANRDALELKELLISGK